jgi:hypothetical protein
MRDTFAGRNETWIALKYFPARRIPVIALRVLFWNIQVGRASGFPTRYPFAGVASACWRWRVALRKRELVDPKVLDAFERRSGFDSTRPISQRLRSAVGRRLGALGREPQRKC